MTRTLSILAVLAGCTPEVPATPSFQQHVQPILAANCVRCHGLPAIGGAPELMRLDSYRDLVVDERDEAGQVHEDVAKGAAALSALIVAGVNGGDPNLSVGNMPPRFPLDDYQIETLERWSAGADASGIAPRGEPRANNHAPTIVVLDTTQTGSIVNIIAEVADEDGDLVAGELRARIGTIDRFVGALRSGEITVIWNTAEIAPAIPPGNYALSAQLDDGAQAYVIELGTLVIGGP